MSIITNEWLPCNAMVSCSVQIVLRISIQYKNPSLHFKTNMY